MAGPVRVRVKVRDVDKGYRDTMRRIDTAKSATIEVGIMGDKGGAAKGALTVLDVATFHEFGMGVPERSFIRGWYDAFHPTAQKQISAMLQAVVKGTRTKSQAMELLGVRWVGEIQKYIVAGTNFQPLARVTILRKGSSAPLIDTGQLKASVTYRVVVK